MIHVEDPRSRAYAELLYWGLLAIRDQARAGHALLCEIEANHLHNIPTLLDEPNEHRHLYYIVKERGRFLRRLNDLGDADYRDRRIWYCSEPWQTLASIAGVDLSEG